MKTIMITGMSSDAGKTTFTMGLLKLLKNKGIALRSFKVGPDYIDPMFHKRITAEGAYNLPAWMVDDDTLRYLFHKRANPSGVNIVEGVMGYFDGRGTESIEGSTAEVAEILEAPVLLIADGSKTALTVAAQIKGLCDFVSPSRIKGVVFNKVNSAHHYELLAKGVETHIGIRCYGYLPLVKDAGLKSRHLGLVQAEEIEDVDAKIQKIADQIEATVAWEALIETFEMPVSVPKSFEGIERALEKLKTRVSAMGGLTLGVARDKAFSFYYDENLQTLEDIGVTLKTFSPLTSTCLPEGIDAVYLGGGYPEVFAEGLEDNAAFRAQFKEAVADGLPVYAECGGLMYLCEGIRQLDGNRYDMVGAFDGEAEMTERLQHFGLVSVALQYNDRTTTYRAHEFHRSKIVGNTCDLLSTVTRKGKTWGCGYHRFAAIGTYAHCHFYSNLDFLDFLISFWSQRK